jgi:hypothetical protein
VASLEQGFSTVHGLMHFLFWQACVAGHSLSEVQPDSTGAAVGNKHVLNNA